MEYKQVSRKEIAAFLEYRMEFVTSIRKIEDVTAFREHTLKYLEEHIGTDDLIIFVAIADEKIVSSAMACIVDTIPLPSCPNGKYAELLNVYTIPEYRRNGFSEKLIHMTITELKKRGVEKIVLTYTEAGLPLYKKIGFISIENQMQMKL